MNRNDVSALISEELKIKRDLTNVQGLDVTGCLIAPLKEIYFLDNGEQLELWTVFKETENGYYIFYDEEEDMFGLAIKSDIGLHNIGYYGTFLKTLYSM
jgi:hypothetical protein